MTRRRSAIQHTEDERGHRGQALGQHARMTPLRARRFSNDAVGQVSAGVGREVARQTRRWRVLAAIVGSGGASVVLLARVVIGSLGKCRAPAAQSACSPPNRPVLTGVAQGAGAYLPVVLSMTRATAPVDGRRTTGRTSRPANSHTQRR